MTVMINRCLTVAFPLPMGSTYVYALPDGVSCEIGERVEAILGRKKIIGWVVGFPEAPPESIDIKPIIRVIDKEPLFDSSYLALAERMAEIAFCSLGEALGTMLPGAKRDREIAAPALSSPENVAEKPVKLSDEQKSAVETILNSGDNFFYLYGITGSGKTEVYLRCAESLLAEGKGIIYLVPEISLTHQLHALLKRRLGNRIAILHSHLTKAQRLSEWRRILSGDAAFVMGARSAVFAPVRNLGLIIVDEEHETSYKAGSTPRYHARQIAMIRRKEEKAHIIFGSATPSVEAWRLMKEGKIRRFALTKRLSGGSPPAISIIDMKKSYSLLSPALLNEMQKCHADGGQTILFLNKRGYSYFYHCYSCHAVLKCQNCSVTLTFHKEKGRFLCHYCGFQHDRINSCPECGSRDTGYSGFGTERIEEEAKRIFPDLKIARLDADTAAQKGKAASLIKDFGDGKIDVLLGTQMVAKGLNFPGVCLVGIVLADTALNLPDFRASERAFSLILQVAGRAGRFAPDGKVFIQTFQPDNPVIKLASTASIGEFYEQELLFRKELDYPPFSRLFRLVFRGREEKRVLAEAVRWRELLKENTGDILGPTECPLGRIARNYRMHIIIKSNNFDKTHTQLRRLRSVTKRASGVYVEFDVDPVSLL